jgi:N-methylhydantoinase B
MLRRYQLRADSFGAGKYRGGAAIEIEIECIETEMTITVRGCDRILFRPWGVAGGEHGSGGSAELRGAALGLVEVLKLQLGDRLTLISPAGGGFGDPYSREPELVNADVRAGLLSKSAALAQYGVALGKGGVDEGATAVKRRSRAIRQDVFRFDEERLRYEVQWPIEAQIELVRSLLASPVGVRQTVDKRVRDNLPTATVATVRAAVEQVRAELLV